MADRAAVSQQARERGHEPSDVSIRGVLWVAIIFAATVALSAVVLAGLLGLFAALRESAVVSPLERTTLLPPEPRLEARPLETLEQVRAREQQLLHGYAWVDREAGIARIPIDRAMAILAERGWSESPGDETFRPARRSLTAP